MGGVSVARPNESLKPTGLMGRGAGVTLAMAAGGLTRRSAHSQILFLWQSVVTSGPSLS